MSKLQPLFTWRSAISDSTLPPATRHVALALSLYMSERGDSAFPGATRLAHDTGLHISTVKAKLADLEEAGWLHCVQRGGRAGERRTANVYVARIPVVSDDRSYPQPVAHDDPSPETTRRPDRADRSSSTTQPVAQDDPISYELPRTPIAPAQRTQASDPLFEAVCRATNTDWTELNQHSRGPLNRAVKSIRESGGTPTDVFRRAGKFTRRWPHLALTPTALAKHWPTLGNGAPATGTTIEDDREAWRDIA